MTKICVVGMGNMGSAILERLLGRFAVVGCGRGDRVDGDVVIMAVKPQQFGSLENEWKDKLIISIMAGVKLDDLGSARAVRTMPNLALKYGKSLTAWKANAGCSEADLVLTKEILEQFGESVELSEESQFDAFTALAGSGPAYFFWLEEELKQAAMKEGFSAEEAGKIARETFLGAAAVAEGSGVDGRELVEKVKSKGGTTEAALRVMEMAVEAAKNRSKELSND